MARMFDVNLVSSKEKLGGVRLQGMLRSGGERQNHDSRTESAPNFSTLHLRVWLQTLAPNILRLSLSQIPMLTYRKCTEGLTRKRCRSWPTMKCLSPRGRISEQKQTQEHHHSAES